MSTFLFFAKAMFGRDGRRWLVLALPSFLVGTLTLVNDHIALLPSSVASAFPWKPRWWAWVIALLLGLLLDAYLVWREQFKRNRELIGRPGVLLTSKYHDKNSQDFMPGDVEGLRLYLENTNENVAVNVSALVIIVPIPERVQEQHRRIKRAYDGIKAISEDATTEPKNWIVSFGIIDSLSSRSGEAVLSYRIENMGLLQQNISHVLSEVAGADFKSCLPLTVVFSNVGNPGRTWHMHYELEYSVGEKKRLGVRSLGFGEVSEGKSTCSRCPRHRHSS